jgi:ribosomal protein L29
MKTNEKKELHHKSIEELKKMLLDNEKELLTARLDHTRGKLKNVSSMTMLRRNIAQILTILRGKELSDEQNA